MLSKPRLLKCLNRYITSWGNINFLNLEPYSGLAFSGLLTDGRGQNGPSPQNLSHMSHNNETWHSYTLPKNIWIMWHALCVPLTLAFFLPEISKFCYIKKYRYKLHFGTSFLVLLTFCESLKIDIINMVTILIMSAKMATLASLI